MCSESVVTLTTMTAPFLDFVHAIVAGDIDDIARRLTADPGLATVVLEVGATRGDASSFFFTDIAHYFYAGDTALHMAAAAFRPQVGALLIEAGANCRARNRRGAEPLHYAADANHWDPTAQSAMIEYLLSIGADPNAIDDDATAPLHRAVRTRSLSAVRALLDRGADPKKPNASGSTPLHLAVWSPGRGGSGEADARLQQAEIIRLLLTRGARPSDKDTRGRTVSDCVTSAWVKALLLR